MIKENNKFCDNIISIVHNEIKKRKLENYITLFPMIRKENDKLYLATMIVRENDNVWNEDAKIKCTYWTLIDTNNYEILEFNKCTEKDFIVNQDFVFNSSDNNQKEISKYEIKKILQYKKYLMDDIKNDKIPIQQELFDILNNEIKIDGQVVNANDYLMANIEQEIEEKIKELVNLVSTEKYSSISYYYSALIENIIDEYKENNTINDEKMLLASKIMSNYYGGIIGIKQLFNI